MFVKAENNSFESVTFIHEKCGKKKALLKCADCGRARTVPPTRERGSLDLCPSIQRSHIINGVVGEKKSRGADGSLRHPIKQSLTL